MGPLESDHPLSPDLYRKRYLELKENAERNARSQPDVQCNSNPRQLAESDVICEETIPAGWYWSRRIARGQTLRIVNGEASPGVSMVLWNAADTSERLNVADTVKVQWTSRICKGHVLLSDMGRVLASITDDTCGMHDCILGGSTSAAAATISGNGERRNSQDNFILAAAKHGMDSRDVPSCMTLFAPVVTDDTGRFHWANGALKPRDFVDLQGEMDLIVALSNCPHPLSPNPNAFPVRITVWQSSGLSADNFCRVVTEESLRAFENTEAMLRMGAKQ